MTTNVKIDLSLKEIIILARNKWKLIALIAILCALLFGAYGVVAAMHVPAVDPSDNDQKLYQENLEYYNTEMDYQKSLSADFKKKWVELSEQAINDPIMKLDANNCSKTQMVVCFEDGTGAHRWTVDNWMNQCDDKELFGEDTNLKQYKNDIIQILPRNYSVGNTNDLKIDIYDVEGFNADNAAKHLGDFIEKQANAQQVVILDITTAKVTGHSEYINDYQKKLMDRLNAYYTATKNIDELNVIFKEPAPPFTGMVSVSKNAIRFGVVGLILGLLLGVCLVVIRVLRRNCLVSDRQMSNAFGLDMLSDYTNRHDVALDVLNANLDVMTGDGNRIMIIDTDNGAEVTELTDKLNKQSDRTFVVGDNLFDNTETIEALNNTDGILLAVRFGKSNAEQIQRILLRARKLNRDVLGYILV